MPIKQTVSDKKATFFDDPWTVPVECFKDL